MGNINADLLIEELKNLISYSISNKEADNEKFETLHCALLKKYFDAKDISINYKEQTIDLKLPMSNKNYTGITFECLDLVGFLQSCIKCTGENIYFYQNLLDHYNVVSAA